MASPNHPLAAALAARSAGYGFNLVGFVDAAEFDACQPSGRRAADLLPGCGTVFVVGSGGRGLWEHLNRERGAIGAAREDFHPIDDWCEMAGTELVAWLADAGVAARLTQPDDDPSLNFMQLAECAGWGTISPVMGLLLHPEFGPWVSLRAALLLEGQPFGAVPAEQHVPFQPCSTCDRPCVQACPMEVYDGFGGIRTDTCATHRHEGQCGSGCDARRACPVGAAARYGPEEERFRHAYSLFSMRRHFGLR